MHTAPDGSPVCIHNRLSEIVKRYGPFDAVTRFIGKATPHLIASVGRASGRLDTSIAPHVLHRRGLAISRALYPLLGDRRIA